MKSARTSRVKAIRTCSPRAHEEQRAFAEGYASFGTQELLEFVLDLIGRTKRARSQQPPLSPSLSTSVLARLGTRPLELSHMLNVSPKAALILAGAFELVARAEPRYEAGETLAPEMVFRWAARRLGQLSHEEVWVLGANSKSQLRSVVQVGRGGLAGCSLLPRDILGPLLREGASAFVLVHNHPSGDPEPSQLDLEMTHELRTLSGRMGVPLLDHVIVARTSYVSLLQNGYLDPPTGRRP